MLSASELATGRLGWQKDPRKERKKFFHQLSVDAHLILSIIQLKMKNRPSKVNLNSPLAQWTAKGLFHCVWRLAESKLKDPPKFWPMFVPLFAYKFTYFKVHFGQFQSVKCVKELYLTWAKPFFVKNCNLWGQWRQAISGHEKTKPLTTSLLCVQGHPVWPQDRTSAVGRSEKNWPLPLGKFVCSNHFNPNPLCPHSPPFGSRLSLSFGW